MKSTLKETEDTHFCISSSATNYKITRATFKTVFNGSASESSSFSKSEQFWAILMGLDCNLESSNNRTHLFG